MLNIPPVRKDGVVVDIDGKKLGKIKKLHRHPDTNQLETIEVSDGFIHSKVVSKAHIWGVGEKVILKMTKDQYRNLE